LINLIFLFSINNIQPCKLNILTKISIYIFIPFSSLYSFTFQIIKTFFITFTLFWNYKIIIFYCYLILKRKKYFIYIKFLIISCFLYFKKIFICILPSMNEVKVQILVQNKNKNKYEFLFRNKKYNQILLKSSSKTLICVYK